MKTIEIARRLAELREKEQALKAYSLALGQEELSPEEELEAATYVFFGQGDYQISYTHWVELYNQGYFREEIMALLTDAFYTPNVKKNEKTYLKNQKALKDYPYLFRKDFLPFEELPILFFPFDDHGFLPYYVEEDRFGPYVDLNRPVIDRYFFKDLSRPILADDVYSQYQLEYLYDNVRPSEWVAQENHIYLNYTNWAVFCSYLQVLKLKPVLEQKKIVFLIENEISRYPIDFQAEYGIDYTQYPVKPVQYTEITRLIWHTQLASDNGGDFFNHIFYEHPNLLTSFSLMFDSVNTAAENACKECRQGEILQPVEGQPPLGRNASKKDAMLLTFWADGRSSLPDPASRIAPALMFQPHFYNIICKLEPAIGQENCDVLISEEFEQIRSSGLFQGFKYIKTFTPVRRFTTSYAATVRGMVNNYIIKAEETAEKTGEGRKCTADQLLIRLLNRTFMADPKERLYQDSCMVRFEDGKLNPKATFTTLAEFLDIPYVPETMSYCSNYLGVNQPDYAGSYVGFDSRPVYNTYDEFTNDEERALLEYFLREAYEYFGYDFHYYKGEPVDQAWIEDKVSRARIFEWMRESLPPALAEWEKKERPEGCELTDAQKEEEKARVEALTEETIASEKALLLRHGENLLNNPKIFSKRGYPLKFIKKLELDPDLLEQPLYH